MGMTACESNDTASKAEKLKQENKKKQMINRKKIQKKMYQ
ncbi:hypothetical protein bcere0007_55070 [Bacillus mycoides]|nr:hypothetical protein bcere0007_55070 [Bacillus mycoides]